SSLPKDRRSKRNPVSSRPARLFSRVANSESSAMLLPMPGSPSNTKQGMDEIFSNGIKSGLRYFPYSESGSSRNPPSPRLTCPLRVHQKRFHWYFSVTITISSPPANQTQMGS